MSFRTFGHPLTASAIALLSGYAAFGCAGTPPPPELLDARAAYMRAEAGQASQYKPDRVHEAKVALDKAERAYEDDPAGQETKDIAYLALRDAELAEVEGRDARAAQDKVHAEKQIASLTQVQLSQTREQLASASDRLNSERTMREEAEKRARDAMDKLAAAGNSVKQESRGTVITIPGNVLFASGKSMLLAGAQARLTTVADVLKDQTDREITVQGHTDSQGSDAANLQLSQARAQAVRDYLVAHGVSANRIRAEGVGESKPIADNASPEGRANNRRVEIIVSGADGKTTTEQRTPSTMDTPYPAGTTKPSSGGASPTNTKK
jgi:outer membrane protein OmpA-like peptidoglycan-associated protein